MLFRFFFNQKGLLLAEAGLALGRNNLVSYPEYVVITRKRQFAVGHHFYERGDLGSRVSLLVHYWSTAIPTTMVISPVLVFVFLCLSFCVVFWCIGRPRPCWPPWCGTRVHGQCHFVFLFFLRGVVGLWLCSCVFVFVFLMQYQSSAISTNTNWCSKRGHGHLTHVLCVLCLWLCALSVHGHLDHHQSVRNNTGGQRAVEIEIQIQIQTQKQIQIQEQLQIHVWNDHDQLVRHNTRSRHAAPDSVAIWRGRSTCPFWLNGDIDLVIRAVGELVKNWAISLTLLRGQV